MLCVCSGQVPCLVVGTAGAAKELFKVHDATFSDRPKRLDHKIISGTTYKSLSSAPYGPYWRQVRRICNTELFCPAVHASHEIVRGEEIQELLKEIVNRCQSGDNAVNLRSWATDATANNMTRMLINKRCTHSLESHRHTFDCYIPDHIKPFNILLVTHLFQLTINLSVARSLLLTSSLISSIVSEFQNQFLDHVYCTSATL